MNDEYCSQCTVFRRSSQSHCLGHPDWTEAKHCAINSAFSTLKTVNTERALVGFGLLGGHILLYPAGHAIYQRQR